MVKELKTRVARVAELLNRYGVEYLIVGGEACNLHGIVRGTKDVDVLLKKTPENAEKALSALGELPFQIAREILPEEILKKPFTIIGDNPRVDLLFTAGRIKYEEAIKDQCETEVEGIKVIFAGVNTLIQSKQTDRAKDQADLEILMEIKKNPIT